MVNKCLNCKFNTLKIMVLVPCNKTIREYIHRTGNFHSDIAAIIKEPHGQYTVWFRSEEHIKPLSFKLIRTCKLRIEPNKKESACLHYEQSLEQNPISTITYSKATDSKATAPTIFR
ncbi:MAG: hypothetical protein NWE98_10700 [Candidatus Bathyarchaeota archaeon]|nr:hypothetical protein [Candidatus Bathyarchaeota archaeon]